MPIMQTADQIKIENLGLVQGTVLALILCGVVALIDIGYPEQNVCMRRFIQLLALPSSLDFCNICNSMTLRLISQTRTSTCQQKPIK